MAVNSITSMIGVLLLYLYAYRRPSAMLYAASVVSGYIIELLFEAARLVPSGPRHAQDGGAGITWNYTSVLDIVFGVLAVVLLVRVVFIALAANTWRVRLNAAMATCWSTGLESQLGRMAGRSLVSALLSVTEPSETGAVTTGSAPVAAPETQVVDVLLLLAVSKGVHTWD